jgi:aldehyde:ferredoxin oxidoreductase
MYGWRGKILKVNLTDQTAQEAPLDEQLAHDYLGGRGLGARLLWDMVGPHVDPLGPDNVLIFANGPMTSSGFQTSGRYSVSTKSPQTGTILDANSGGFFGMRFKNSGYDAVIVAGEAKVPIYLQIAPEGVQFKDAGHVWGKTVSQTTEILGGKTVNVLCIGPAGENLVRFSAIMNDKYRALGRGGPGAVMGAKRLKAIVISGDEKPTVQNSELLKFIRYESSKMLRSNPVTSQGYPEFGTAVLVNILNTMGAFPTRNFQQSQFEQAEDISGEAIADTILVKNKACWACPISCSRYTKTDKAEGEGPEYETVWALGAACGVSDLVAITEANYLCNDLGMDTISAGSTIACAMELSEKGLFASNLRFGRADLLAPTLDAIARRSCVGAALAEGSARLARACGASELSMTVKGLEMPAYDPRGMQGQGLLYATSNRGACHMRGNMVGAEMLGLPKLIDRFQYQGKAGYVITHQNMAAVIDSMGICKFVNTAVPDDYLARALSAVTGVEYSTGGIHCIGNRIWNLERLYNLREGFTRTDDTLPPRLLAEPVVSGPAKGWVVHLEPMLAEYYRARGWDANGVPTPATLKRLGLDSLA